ncbi:MAG TPA: tetratricopeptide repeat protein [Acidimicrobiales bacterium]|nr:tetratricopeptide repeat protein [Acidimicrobiales bacterium]
MAIDVTDATFQTEVIERSDAVPVVVDLWAPWCGPCVQLGPIIEKVVDDTEGAVVLVKVNVDENPQISQAFQVQGIPAVFALKDQKVVDTFVGARPEADVKAFVDGLLPTAEDIEIGALMAIADEASFRKVLELRPDHHDASVALAEVLVGSDRADEALEVLARIPETAETRRVAALARTGGADAVDTGDVAARLESLLSQVKNDDEARQEFVDLLEVLGAEDERTAEFRKKLTSALY